MPTHEPDISLWPPKKCPHGRLATNAPISGKPGWYRPTIYGCPLCPDGSQVRIDWAPGTMPPVRGYSKVLQAPEVDNPEPASE